MIFTDKEIEKAKLIKLIKKAFADVFVLRQEATDSSQAQDRATCANFKCSNTFVKRNNAHKYCCEECRPFNRTEYDKKRVKYKGKPKWDVIWYRQYRDKYIAQIKAIPHNQWLEVKAVEPTYCEELEKFFGLNGSPMTKQKDINKGNCLTNYRHIRILLCYFHIIHIPPNANMIMPGVRRLTKKIKQYRLDNKIAVNKQRMANALGLEYFPRNKYTHIDDDEIYFVGLSILGCDNLSHREKCVLRARYGLDGTGVTKSYGTIGAQIGLSKERVSQIFHDGIRKLSRPSYNPLYRYIRYYLDEAVCQTEV